MARLVSQNLAIILGIARRRFAGYVAAGETVTDFPKLPALIRVKRAAGRPKDLEALAELEGMLEERQED